MTTSLLRAIVVVLAALVAGIAWALASPIGASPDDDYHMASTWCPMPLEESGCNPMLDPEGKMTVEVPESLVTATCYAFNGEASAACQLSSSDTKLARTSRVDTGEYPGGFYKVMHLFVGENVDASIVAMRLFNVALSIGLFAGVAATMNRAGRRVLTVAVLASIVPLGTFMIASVNPSSWSITGVTVAWLSLHSYLTAETPVKKWAAAGLFAVGSAMAVASRADAAIYLVVVSIVIVFLHLKTVIAKPVLAWPAAVMVIVGAIGFFTSGQSGVASSGVGTYAEQSGLGLLVSNMQELPRIYVGFFGLQWGLSWFDTPMPTLTWFPALFIGLAIAFVGLRRMDRIKALSMLAILGVLVVLPLLILQMSSAQVGSGVQPRYLLPLLPVLLGVGWIGVDRTKSERLSRAQAALVAAGLTLANSMALHQVLRRFIVGLDVPAMRLDKHVEWWWDAAPSPMAVWTIGSLAFAVMTSVLFHHGLADDPRPARVEAQPRAEIAPAVTTRVMPVVERPRAREVEATQPTPAVERPRSAPIAPDPADDEATRVIE